MSGTIKRTATAAGNAFRAVFRRRKSGWAVSAGACVSCAAGVAAVLLLSATTHAQQPGESFRDCPSCPEMVMLPAGEFMMGSPPSETGRRDNEGPLHKVAIPRPFAVGKYEVTKVEYLAFLSEAPLPVPWGGASDLFTPLRDGTSKYPVANVSWEEAKRYVAWLSKETGHEYRLLSESEWEYAARAETRTAYHWGGDVGMANAHCKACETRWDGEDSPVPVGSFAANGFGLHDMHGNVWEWVEDCWNGSYDDAPSDGQAWRSGDCEHRVFRGGSWFNRPEFLRAALRNWNAAGRRNDFVGFRVARTN